VSILVAHRCLPPHAGLMEMVSGVQTWPEDIGDDEQQGVM
jgi:hypothetical protein